VRDSGIRVRGVECRVQDSRFRVWSVLFRVEGLGCAGGEDEKVEGGGVGGVRDARREVLPSVVSDRGPEEARVAWGQGLGFRGERGFRDCYLRQSANLPLRVLVRRELVGREREARCLRSYLFTEAPGHPFPWPPLSEGQARSPSGW